MPLVEWNESLSVGVDVLDEEHRKMVDMLNEIYDSMRRSKGPRVMHALFDKMLAYSYAHFKHEEALFDETDFPGAAAHKKEHEDLTAQLAELQKKIKTNPNAGPSIEVINYLRKWLVDHIQGSDQDYSAHLKEHGIH